MRDGIRSKKNSILIFFEEFSCRARLAPQLPNPGTKFDVLPDGWEPGREWRRVEVFGEDRRRTGRPGPASPA